jgi:hypothetical protein
MRSLHGTYVHRGDLARRRKRVRSICLAAGFGVAVTFVVVTRRPQEARAAERGFFSFPALTSNGRELAEVRGELELARTELARANRIIRYSSHYDIGADLAASILDIALAEGIEPELAFRLVKIESGFNPRAVSPVGAIGLTQLMPATAAYFQRGVTATQLKEPETNLRIGFRYLRALIREHDGDLKLALLTYNRGPVIVEELRQLGVDPGNGYETAVMRGYNGSGTVD